MQAKRVAAIVMGALAAGAVGAVLAVALMGEGRGCAPPPREPAAKDRRIAELESELRELRSRAREPRTGSEGGPLGASVGIPRKDAPAAARPATLPEIPERARGAAQSLDVSEEVLRKAHAAYLSVSDPRRFHDPAAGAALAASGA